MRSAGAVDVEEERRVRGLCRELGREGCELDVPGVRVLWSIEWVEEVREEGKGTLGGVC